MSHNTFGHLFRVTTFGESHGVAIGCVVDGCPPQIPLTVEEIQRDLDRRRPGQSRFTTQRQEPDAVKILSGVMAHPESGAQVTTGTPIGLLIENTDQRSKDYSDIKDKFRPGHADYTYEAKYGLCDYRGGGRSPARAAADAPRRARRRCGLRQARSRARYCPASRCVARWCRWVRTRSIATSGIGTRSRKIRSSVLTMTRRPSSRIISMVSARAARRSVR